MFEHLDESCSSFAAPERQSKPQTTGVQVFYLNTMKWFVDLYGHKLPALTLDISSDSTLLVSGAADKNIKIWGLDFGDCHKSLFAHQDSVMSVAFVNKTHYVFTAGKDGMVKYWDADKFELLLELPGHHSEVRTSSFQLLLPQKPRTPGNGFAVLAAVTISCSSPVCFSSLSQDCCGASTAVQRIHRHAVVALCSSSLAGAIAA